MLIQSGNRSVKAVTFKLMSGSNPRPLAGHGEDDTGNYELLGFKCRVLTEDKDGVPHGEALIDIEGIDTETAPGEVTIVIDPRNIGGEELIIAPGRYPFEVAINTYSREDELLGHVSIAFGGNNFFEVIKEVE